MTSSEQFRVVCIYCLSLVGSGLVVFIFLTLVTVIRIEDEEGNYFIMNPEVLIKISVIIIISMVLKYLLVGIQHMIRHRLKQVQVGGKHFLSNTTRKGLEMYYCYLQQHELDPFPPVESDRIVFKSDFSPRACLELGAPILIIVN